MGRGDNVRAACLLAVALGSAPVNGVEGMGKKGGGGECGERGEGQRERVREKGRLPRLVTCSANLCCCLTLQSLPLVNLFRGAHSRGRPRP